MTEGYNFNGCSPPVMTELKVGSKSLATYTYGPGNGLLQKQSFANGDSISFATGNIPGAIGAGTAGTGFVGAGALLTGLG